jgi:hypothetical protein
MLTFWYFQRELANQTYDNVLAWTKAMSEGGFPPLNTLLCIGGISMAEQSHVFNKGLHIVVATPGRLMDLLEKRRFNLECCKFLCMDEADRMIDLGFEDDVRNIMSFFKVCLSPARPPKPFNTGFLSINARPFSSLPRCRAKSKILPSSPLYDLFS